MYKKYVDLDIEIWRNIFVANSCIELAKTIAPTVYSLNLLRNFFSNTFTHYNIVKKIIKDELPKSLVGHQESKTTDHDFRTYHVKDEKVLKDYSQQIIDNLLTLQGK